MPDRAAFVVEESTTSRPRLSKIESVGGCDKRVGNGFLIDVRWMKTNDAGTRSAAQDWRGSEFDEGSSDATTWSPATECRQLVGPTAEKRAEAWISLFDPTLTNLQGSIRHGRVIGDRLGAGSLD